MATHVCRLLRTFVLVAVCTGITWAASGTVLAAASHDKSDFNRDKVIDEQDLALFSSRKLDREWSNVDWCEFHAATIEGAPVFGASSKPYSKHYPKLLDFIFESFGCGTGPLDLTNAPLFPARIATDGDPGGWIYVTDPKVGSVFYYDAQLALSAELKNVATPLGIAMDSQGKLLVGSDGDHTINVYG